MALKTIFITTTGAGSFTIPADWTSVNSIHVLGAGAGGKTGAAAASGGGGAGQYRTITNITKTPGASITISVGAAGGAGANGGNTWWDGASFNTGTVNAQGGQTTATGTGGVGGSTGTGGSGNNGGPGGVGPTGTSGGGAGGGAAGPGGVGGTGGDGRTGGGGNDFGGSGGGGAGSSAAGGNGAAGTTSAGAVGTGGATGGGDGGAGGQGSGVAPSTSSPAPYLWTSTHATDAITPSVATARPGGGAGGGGSAAASAGGAANAAGQYGGGGGGANNGTAGQGANGIIVVTYETESRIDSWGQPPRQPDPRGISLAKAMAVVTAASGLFAPLPVPSRAVVSWAQLTGITGGSAVAPETVTVDKWYRPLAEPTLRKGLSAAVVASSGDTAPAFTPETVKIDWHRPLSEPSVKKTVLSTATTSASGSFAPVLTPSDIKIDWHRPLSEPVLRTGLKTAQQLDFAAPVFVNLYLDWHRPLAEPVLRGGLKTSQQDAYTAPVFVPLEDFDWFNALTEPSVKGRSLATASRPALTWSGFTPAGAEEITVDKWLAKLSEPIRSRALATAQQNAWAGPVFTPPIAFGWYRPLTEPPKGLDLPAHAQSAFFWSEYAPAVAPGVGTGLASVVGGPPPQVKTLLYPSRHEPVPVIASETVTLDKWFSPLAQPTRRKPGPSLGSVTNIVPWLSAPVLTWTGDQADNTPDFDIEFDDSADEGAVITLQIDDDINFGSPATYTDTLDAGEVSAGEVILATADLAVGTYYARARVTDGGIDSAWSNTEIVTVISAVSSWSGPIAKPPRGLSFPVHAQDASFWSGFTPTAEIVTVDKWFAPLSSPVRTRTLATAQQDALFWSGFTPSGEVVTVDKWYAPLSGPVRTRILATAQHNAIAGPLFVPLEDFDWYRSLSEPPKPKAQLATAAQPSYVAPVFTPPSLDWHRPLAEPPRAATLARALHPAIAAPAFTPAISTDWHLQQNEPPKPRLSLPVVQQDAFFWSGFTEAPSEIVTVDKWLRPLSEPVRFRQGLAAPQQDPLAWSGFTPAPSFDWFAPLSEPPKPRRGQFVFEQIALAWSTFTPPPSYAWFVPLALPPKKNVLPVSEQRAFAWGPFAPVAEVTNLGKWYRPLSEPVRVRLGLRVGDQQYLAFVKAEPFEGTSVAAELSILTDDKRILVFALEMYPGPSPDRVA